MARRTLTLEESEDLRKYGKLDTWPKFLDLWRQITTVEEAVSLLYVGAQIRTPDLISGSNWPEGVSKRADFFLTIANHTNKALATVAQQLVVKRLLPITRIRNDWVKLHKRLLEFLKEPKESLYSPPYPRFVREYMVDRVLKATLSGKPDFSALSPTSPELLDPLIAWGFVDAIDCYDLLDHQREEFLTHLSSYLKERDYSPLRAFQGFWADGLPGEIDHTKHDERVNMQVAQAAVSIAGHEDIHSKARKENATALIRLLR